MKRTGIDCFAGIGGFSLAMRNCGIEPKVQIEIDEYCQRVLEKNFPKAKRFRDICTVTANDIRRHKPWIICGGFPCQDISCAGKGTGANEGERSGLWREMWRLIRTARPTWLLLENVPALRTRGADSVLVALEALGYTTWPVVVGALHVLAPHERKRIWILAHAESDIRGVSRHHRLESFDWSSITVEHIESERARSGSLRGGSKSQVACPSNSGLFPAPQGIDQFDWEKPRAIQAQSGVVRAVHGLPFGLDVHRIKALGNAIVPQVAESILRAIIAADEILSEE